MIATFVKPALLCVIVSLTLHEKRTGFNLCTSITTVVTCFNGILKTELFTLKREPNYLLV